MLCLPIHLSVLDGYRTEAVSSESRLGPNGTCMLAEESWYRDFNCGVVCMGELCALRARERDSMFAG